MDIQETQTYGPHLMLDCYGAPPEALSDVSLIFDFLDKLPSMIGMQKIGSPQIARFEDEALAGVTGIIMIVTSHISIHTYALKGCFFLDVFSCKPFEPAIVIAEVNKRFKPEHTNIAFVQRGFLFPTRNIHQSPKPKGA